MQPERYLAVDNVCAWPNLTLLPDGSLAAVIFNQPTHGGWEGDVECWASADGGRTWRLRGVPAPHEPGTNRMNVAAGLAPDGRLLVLASGWSNRNPPGRYSNPHEGSVLPPWACRSDDAGRTWTRLGTIPPPSRAMSHVVPFGDIVTLPDGTAGACLYGGSSDNRSSGAFWFVSADQGASWSCRGTIRADQTTETTPLLLPDGRLLAAARTTGDQHLELLDSEDRGVTWRARGPLTLGGQHPGHLLRLADGRILLCYGIRNRGLYGIGARLSPDDGRTWEPPRLLLNFETATDGGYPASVQLPDGTIVTAYYANRTPAHHRYHMGALLWHPDDGVRP